MIDIMFIIPTAIVCIFFIKKYIDGLVDEIETLKEDADSLKEDAEQWRKHQTSYRALQTLVKDERKAVPVKFSLQVDVTDAGRIQRHIIGLKAVNQIAENMYEQGYFDTEEHTVNGRLIVTLSIKLWIEK